MKISIIKPPKVLFDELNNPHVVKKIIKSGKRVYKNNSDAGRQFWVGPFLISIEKN
jgi:hypothetical protein